MASKIESAEWGPWSLVSTAATLPGVPGIVSNMSAVSESNSLNLEWTIPSEPNGPINYYTVRSRFHERGWFYQNTTNTRIVIPTDCNNVTEGTALTTNVAAVNIVNSSKLRGEWAQRDYPVCELQDIVTILPTVLQNIDKIKAINITLTVIIVPSVIVLIMIIGRIVIKKYSKLDLRGSPNLSRRYQLKRR
ncbi:uncharacterized protein LOC117116706 [Anneissia japonica]|uniref:uncharacterized protein LOC117116706 n=1 Tax=Anneissia japonica TaxID=1529436 RepID=UPI0014259BD7|nr:uncharacterized protein LOC117116706 [Anneissia japonica]